VTQINLDTLPLGNRTTDATPAEMRGVGHGAIWGGLQPVLYRPVLALPVPIVDDPAKESRHNEQCEHNALGPILMPAPTSLSDRSSRRPLKMLGLRANQVGPWLKAND
jgi:hypothetical protein